MPDEKDREESKRELADILSDIRKNKNQMENFVEALEGSLPNKGEDTENFCKRYTILVFEKYCHSVDDRELMLAACGLLQGFHEDNMEDRIEAYWQHSRGYNEFFKKYKKASSALRMSRTEMNRIMDYLVKDLISDRDKNNGQLRLKVPDILELPTPRKKEDDMKEEVIEKEAEPDKPQSNQFGLICRLKQQFHELSPNVQRLFAIVAIVAVVSLIACCYLAFELLRLKTNKNEEVKEAIAATKRIMPTSIEIKNKYIQLYPGGHDYLEVYVTPDGIDILDLDYTSSCSKVVTADKTLVTALYGWDENACHDVKITVQGGGIASAVAEVTVLKPKDLDGVGNTLAGGDGN